MRYASDVKAAVMVPTDILDTILFTSISYEASAEIVSMMAPVITKLPSALSAKEVTAALRSSSLFTPPSAGAFTNACIVRLPVVQESFMPLDVDSLVYASSVPSSLKMKIWTVFTAFSPFSSRLALVPDGRSSV